MPHSHFLSTFLMKASRPSFLLSFVPHSQAGCAISKGKERKCNEQSHTRHLSLFSPHMQILVKFFSTQKCVNQDKTDCATKKNVKCDKINYKTKQFKLYIYVVTLSTKHTSDVEKFHISMHLSCGKI